MKRTDVVTHLPPRIRVTHVRIQILLIKLARLVQQVYDFLPIVNAARVVVLLGCWDVRRFVRAGVERDGQLLRVVESWGVLQRGVCGRGRSGRLLTLVSSWDWWLDGNMWLQDAML